MLSDTQWIRPRAILHTLAGTIERSHADVSLKQFGTTLGTILEAVETQERWLQADSVSSESLVKLHGYVHSVLLDIKNLSSLKRKKFSRLLSAFLEEHSLERDIGEIRSHLNAIRQEISDQLMQRFKTDVSEGDLSRVAFQSKARFTKERAPRDGSKRVSLVQSRIKRRRTQAFMNGAAEVVSDLDGTILPPGTKEFDSLVLPQISRLAARGISSIPLTGKPLTEVRALVRTVPKHIPLRIIFEKGAYVLEKNGHGKWSSRYLLSNREIEKGMEQIKRAFLNKWAPEIMADYRVAIALAGDGTHKSVLSFDIKTPKNRIPDRALICQITKQVVKEIQKLNIPAWVELHIDNLGNGNVEICPIQIEKTLAIAQAIHISSHRNILYMGDSGNDKSVFKMSRRLRNMKACLVFHAQTPRELLRDADYMVFGSANGGTFLKFLSEQTKS